MVPKVVLVITDRETNAQLKKLGVDLLELRVDLFKKAGAEHARRQFQNRRKLHLPLILTVRNQKKEGATKAMSESKKWELLQALIPLADWVDIELSSPSLAKAVALARKHRKNIILSAHDFKRTPTHLGQILKKALSSRGDIVKIAARANSPQDFVRMAEFTHRNRRRPLATMCMGQWGGLSRLILPSLGSRLIYTFADRPTAPGQMDVKTLLKAVS